MLEEEHDVGCTQQQQQRGGSSSSSGSRHSVAAAARQARPCLLPAMRLPATRACHAGHAGHACPPCPPCRWLRWHGAGPNSESIAALATSFLAFYVANSPAGVSGSHTRPAWHPSDQQGNVERSTWERQHCCAAPLLLTSPCPPSTHAFACMLCLQGSGVIAVVVFGLWGNFTRKWGMLAASEESGAFDACEPPGSRAGSACVQAGEGGRSVCALWQRHRQLWQLWGLPTPPTPPHAPSLVAACPWHSHASQRLSCATPCAPAVWDACTLGANGLVFFWSGCACANFLIRRGLLPAGPCLRGRVERERGVPYLRPPPMEAASCKGSSRLSPRCAQPSQVPRPPPACPLAPCSCVQERGHAGGVCLVLGRHPHHLRRPGGPAHRQLCAVQLHRLPVAKTE